MTFLVELSQIFVLRNSC